MYRYPGMLIAAVIALAGCISVSSEASDWEHHWKCDNLDLYHNTDQGRVVVPGIDVATSFRIDGLAQRWDWGSGASEGYDYTVVLENGINGMVARYYDFDGKKTANARTTFFNCDKQY